MTRSERIHVKTKQAEILILEDDPRVLRGLEMLFRAMTPWTIHSFAYYEEAMTFLEDFSVDLMLVDLQFDMYPDVNGIDFLESAKKLHPEATQILLSGRADKPHAIAAINRLDLYAFIEKPYDAGALLKVVDNGLEKRFLLHQARENYEELKRTNIALTQAKQLLEETNQQLQEANEHLKRTQEDLLRQQKQAAIGELIQGICHNLNTPLALVVGQAELLEDGLQAFEESHGYPPLDWRPAIHLIQEAVERIQQLTHNLMSKSRMEQTQERQPICLNHLLKQEITFLQADPFLRHQVEFQVELSPSMPKLLLNYADFSQIFGNLIRNALDEIAMLPQPRLFLASFVRDEHAGFALHDNGRGVPLALREVIFDPFFTTKKTDVSKVEEKSPDVFSGTLQKQEMHREARKTWTSQMSGTGLGLHSVRQLLAAYHGTVEVCTSSLLGGACFTVTIPLQEHRISTE